MDCRYMEKVKSVMQWGKIILPLSSIRYYPPQFTLRNPLIEGVSNAFRAGLEVAVIVFKLRNQRDLLEQTEIHLQSKVIKTIKKLFQIVVEQEVSQKEFITLHDYYGEGITLLITVDHDRHSISNIDLMMKRITEEVEQRFIKLYPTVYPFLKKDICLLKNMTILSRIQYLEHIDKQLVWLRNENSLKLMRC
jgi:GTP1/Obg family GTP-binding protein